MKNNLENRLKKHAKELFGSDPLQGHRDRFADKLQAVSKSTLINEQPSGQHKEALSHSKRIPLRNIISYLSAAALLTGVIYLIHHQFINDYSQENEPLSEVQNYYSLQLQDEMEHIEQLLEMVNEEDRPELMKDIETMLSEADTDWLDSDENNTEFIFLAYSSKIEALQHIHDILEPDF